MNVFVSRPAHGFYFLFLLLGLITLGFVAQAQENEIAPSAAATDQTDVAAKAVTEAGPDEDIDARKMQLSRDIHRVRPIRPQIDRAIERLSQAAAPADRAPLQAAMKRIMNYGAMQYFSTKAMAETFTVDELEVMLAYYTKPEAASAADKMQIYQDKIAPEIVKMMDAAVMELRTGRSDN